LRGVEDLLTGTDLPKFVFVDVQTKVNMQFLAADDSDQNWAPAIVNDCAKLDQQEFYLYSKLDYSSALYNIRFNNTHISKQQIQHLTYQQCFLYFNCQ
jgi:hypothetical protein